MSGRDRHEERRGFGGAEAGQHRHPEAGLLHREFVEAVPDEGRQRRAREEHRMQPAEEFCAQRRVVAQIRQQRFIALGHVEIDRRRNLAQIAHRLLDAAGHRLALVEIHRAAIEQRQPDIVIAAEGVIPRQPVDDHRRLVLQERQRLAQHHLIGADHALGVDDGLGIAGRARGQQEFCDGVRADRVMRCIEARMFRRRQQIGQQRHVAAGHRAARGRDLGSRGHVGQQRIGELRGVVGEHQARRQQLHQEAELAVIASTPANRPATPDRTECRHRARRTRPAHDRSNCRTESRSAFPPKARAPAAPRRCAGLRSAVAHR